MGWECSKCKWSSDIFLRKGGKGHQRLRGNNLVTKYVLPEGSCVIPNKAANMDDKTWEKVGKVVAPGIRKMSVSNVASFIYFIIYLSNYTCLHLRIFCRLFVTSQIGGSSSHMMDSSLPPMSMKASTYLRSRGSGSGRRRLV